MRTAQDHEIFSGNACTGYFDHPFKNKHVQTEKDLHSLLANTGWSVYYQMSSTADSCSNNAISRNGEASFMVGIFASLKRLLDGCLEALTSRFAR
jgi:hypothetical protein